MAEQTFGKLTGKQTEVLKAIATGDPVPTTQPQYTRNLEGAVNFVTRGLSRSIINTLQEKGLLSTRRDFWESTGNKAPSYAKLTPAGIEYATAQGWLAAPTEAQQAAPVASADSGEAAKYDQPQLPTKADLREVMNNRQRETVYSADGLSSIENAGLFSEVFQTMALMSDDDATPAAQPTSAQAGGEAGSDAPRHWTHEWNMRHVNAALNTEPAQQTVHDEIIISLVVDYENQVTKIARLESELATARAALKKIATNAPQEEPAYTIEQRRAFSIAHSYWYAGVMAKELLGID